MLFHTLTALTRAFTREALAYTTVFSPPDCVCVCHGVCVRVYVLGAYPNTILWFTRTDPICWAALALGPPEGRVRCLTHWPDWVDGQSDYDHERTLVATAALSLSASHKPSPRKSWDLCPRRAHITGHIWGKDGKTIDFSIILLWSSKQAPPKILKIPLFGYQI